MARIENCNSERGDKGFINFPSHEPIKHKQQTQHVTCAPLGGSDAPCKYQIPTRTYTPQLLYQIISLPPPRLRERCPTRPQSVMLRCEWTKYEL